MANKTGSGILSKLLIVALSAAAAAMLALYLLQDQMVFPAPKNALDGPLPEGFSVVEISTPDGETLHSFFHPPQEGEATIIVFHGNADLASWQLGRGKKLADANFGVLLAEYRGYGESTGSASETGLFMDAEASYEFIRSKTSGPIGINAHSLGTGVALSLATRRDVFALVLDAPYDSILAIAKARFPFIPVGPFLRHPFRSDLLIPEIDKPILILHGTDDPVVPMSHARNLQKLGGDNISFVEFEGAGHQLTGFGSVEHAIEFFRSRLP